MVAEFDRRIFHFPAVHPCQDITLTALLHSLITISRNLSAYKTKFFPTQRKNAREINRQISLLSIFFDEIQRGHVFPNRLSKSFMELHLTFQKIQFLFEDCTRQGARIWILMKSHFVTTLFHDLLRGLSISLQLLPLNSMKISVEVKEMMKMLSNQSKTAKINLESEDEITMERVMIVFNQFADKSDPDPFIIRKILGYLRINSWADCHREIEFLEEEIQPEDDKQDILLKSDLMGFLIYCRGIVFEDCDSKFVAQSNCRNNIEIFNCLNPEDFRCPISLELMTDPVTVSTGQTYDRVSIEKWLNSGNTLCPKTGEKLESSYMVPNLSLKKIIQQFMAGYGVSLEKKSRDKHQVVSNLQETPSTSGAIKILSEFLALRLSYGNKYQKIKATREIILLSKSSSFYPNSLIEAGSIQPLIKLLDSCDPEMQENAIAALLKLSKLKIGKNAITGNMGQTAVISVLKNGMTSDAKQIAAAMIFYLCEVHENRKIIGKTIETIPALLEMIEKGTSRGKKNSLMAFFAILLYRRNRKKAIADGSIGILLKVLSGLDSVELKKEALGVLSMLADTVDGSMEILQAFDIRLIVGLLQSLETQTGKEYCVSILLSLCLNCGFDVVCVLAKEKSLMHALYSVMIEGTEHGKIKSRSLIRILQKFSEKSYSCQ